MRTLYDINVSYAQICVFRPSLSNPYNDWCPKHCDQGFSWRQDSVSSGIPDDGLCQVALSDDEINIKSGKIFRCIMTPFDNREKYLDIRPITDTNIFNYPVDKYQSTFVLREMNDQKYKYLVEIIMRRNTDPILAVLKAVGGLSNEVQHAGPVAPAGTVLRLM